MIIYISENLNNKKNGGSSTSGFEFLQILRIYFNKVVVVTLDKINFEKESKEFYGYRLNKIHDVINIKRSYIVRPFTIKKMAKKIFYFFKDYFNNKNYDLSKFYSNKSSENIIFVNSWSSLFNKEKIKNIDGFKKVCIVRGSPESFIWQSFDNNKDVAIKNAAEYLELFDSLIFVSSNGLKSWNKIFKKTIKSFYLPNSINEFDIKDALELNVDDCKIRLGMNLKDFNIIVVGSVQKRKAQDILLLIIKDLVNIIPNVKFHIVGGISDTWGGVEIYNEIKKSKYSDYFIFHGHSDQQIIYMQASDLCLFTSRAEAFPRTLAEYMAVGKPIVASNVSGVNEMIKDGINGFLYTNENLNKASTSIINLYKNGALANKLAKQARKDYFEKFSKEKHINKAINVFAKLK